MVHGLVHSTAVGDEPVVDASQCGQHAAANSGLLGDLTNGGLLRGLAEFDMALGQRPEHAAASVNAADEGRDLRITWAVDTVDDQPASGCFVHGSEPLRRAAR